MSAFEAAGPLLRLIPPERAHALTIAALEAGLGPRARAAPPALATTLAGLRLPNPIGLAAGFDKDARAWAPLLRAGFGFVEVGTLTPRAQAGNSGVRVWRLPRARGIVNRLGFNNGGQASALARLTARDRALGVVGVNVGANRDSPDRAADYATGVAAMAGFADYLTVNVSSPNTPGLRALQAVAALEPLVVAALAASGPGGPPLFVKIAPDLSDAEVEAVADLALRLGVDGLIATNTTLARPDGIGAGLEGGLSGPPLAARAAQVTRRLRGALRGRVAIVGVGGIASGAEAYARIRAGADAVQLYTGLVYGGPGLVARIGRELAALLARDGFARVADAVGADA